MSKKIKPVDLSKVTLHSIAERESIVSVKDFAKPAQGGYFSDFVDCIPNILAGREIRAVSKAIVSAKAGGKPVMWACGAHFIKCGLNPLLIDLMEKGFVSSISLNGGGVIHDVEVALFGQTSEDVTSAIRDGSFGMVRETGEFINQAVEMGYEKNLGFAESVGEALVRENPKHLEQSLLGACRKNNICATAHIAIGTDIIHSHPTFDPKVTGAATHLDFRIFSSMVGELSGGGVYLNVGSAVILPEVFLKAVSLSRNLGVELVDFTCANFDFKRQYRAFENVLKRPGGKSHFITGHHELTLPLLYKMLLED